jgi:hypothetical protein
MWAAFAGVERDRATFASPGRRASHARGRRFETRRAHWKKPWNQGFFLISEGPRLEREPPDLGNSAQSVPNQCPPVSGRSAKPDPGRLARDAK